MESLPSPLPANVKVELAKTFTVVGKLAVVVTVLLVSPLSFDVLFIGTNVELSGVLLFPRKFVDVDEASVVVVATGAATTLVLHVPIVKFGKKLGVMVDGLSMTGLLKVNPVSSVIEEPFCNSSLLATTGAIDTAFV